MKLTIRTPEKTVFNGEIKNTQLFTEQGLMKIFPNHSSLTGSIDFSPLVFTDSKDNKEEYLIRRGTVMISNQNNSIEIMSFECKHKSEASPTDAKEYLAFIEEQLAKGTDLSEFSIEFYEQEKYVIEKKISHLEK